MSKLWIVALVLLLLVAAGLVTKRLADVGEDIDEVTDRKR
jgi:hypothetical protein